MRKIAVIALLTVTVPALAAPRITLHAERESLADFAQAVSRQAHVRLVLAKELAKERITAHLNGVTIADVLDILKNYKGVQAERLSDGVYSLRRRS